MHVLIVLILSGIGENNSVIYDNSLNKNTTNTYNEVDVDLILYKTCTWSGDLEDLIFVFGGGGFLFFIVGIYRVD